VTTLVWRPEWHRPHESFWSVLNKLAFANDTSVGEILAHLVGSARALRSMTLTVEPRIAMLICRALRLAFSHAAQLFAGVRPVPLEHRQWLQIGLRWCPKCLEEGFHSVVFQDWRVLKCPWHGCQVMDCCPDCRCAVDPLSAAPWRCNVCDCELYRPPREWLSAFRAVPLWVEQCAPASRHGIQVTPAGDALRFCVVEGGDQVKGGRLLTGRYAETVVTQAAFEELSSLSEVVFPDHDDCLTSHHHLCMVQCSIMSFECIPAAAVVRTGAVFGLGLSEGEVGWASGEHVAGRYLHALLRADLEELPDWCHRPYAQAVARALLADALSDFRTAHEHQRTSEWQPFKEVWPSWSFKGAVLTLRGTANVEMLESAASIQHRPLAGRLLFRPIERESAPLHQMPE
jgi:hypothetical protein